MADIRAQQRLELRIEWGERVFVVRAFHRIAL